jgi:GNAT superfamily N-acetyltransferase
MTRVSIRRVESIAEFRFIDEMHKSCFKERTPNLRKGHWWIGWDQGTPVCFGGLVPSIRQAHTDYLIRSGVMPSHRGQGLQRRLIAARERQARWGATRFVVTDTSVHNPASANSLIRCGYKLYIPSDLYSGVNWLYWKKDLED